MFNPWYSADEVDVGPLGENNELTLGVEDFIRYTNLIKSKKRISAAPLPSDPNLVAGKERESTVESLPNYMLSEFLIGQTRLNYFDSQKYIGVASRQYASQTVLQNLERMVMHPDIGFYFMTMNSTNKGTADNTKKAGISEPLSG